jgi:hypothetical protein
VGSVGSAGGVGDGGGPQMMQTVGSLGCVDAKAVEARAWWRRRRWLHASVCSMCMSSGLKSAERWRASHMTTYAAGLSSSSVRTGATRARSHVESQRAQASSQSEGRNEVPANWTGCDGAKEMGGTWWAGPDWMARYAR